MVYQKYQMKSKGLDIYSAAKSAICISLLSATAYLVIPVPPSGISLMTIMVNLIGLVLTPLQAGLSMAAYLLMGLIGLPVFSGGTSGPSKIFGPTGGYYFGFVLAAVLISLFKGKEFSFSRYSAVTILVGIPAQHVCAIIMMCIYGVNIKDAFLTISLPFILGDIIKAVMASYVGVKVNERIEKIYM